MSEFEDRLLYAADASEGDQYIGSDMTVYRIAGIYNAMNPDHLVLSVHPASRPDRQVYREVSRSFTLGLRHNATTGRFNGRSRFTLNRDEVMEAWNSVHSRYGNLRWQALASDTQNGIMQFAAELLRRKLDESDG